jgi:hypothetical protein
MIEFDPEFQKSFLSVRRTHAGQLCCEIWLTGTRRQDI